jgi:hypothetical protein
MSYSTLDVCLQRMRTVPVSVVVMVVLILVCQLGPVKAQGSFGAPGMSVSISDGSTTVSISLHASQNLTYQDRFFSLPYFNGRLIGQNASALTSIVQDSIRELSPRASVNNLVLALSSSPPTNGTVLQWFNVTLLFQVSGVQTAGSGTERTDLAWKSFVIASNVTVGGVEVNTIGDTYLLPTTSYIQLLETQQGVPQRGTFSPYRNLVNNRIVTATGIPTALSRVQLLNFNRFLPPIDSWEQSYIFASRSTMWSLTAEPNLGFIIQQTISEPHATQTINSGFFYNLQAAITAPARSFAQGNTILSVFIDTTETLMGTIVASVLALGTVTYLYERRVLSLKITRKAKR